eukprot:jgi/Psemu1/50470/gm1.50470_g
MMNTQFQPCIHYKRTFDVTEAHDSHKIVVDYAKATNRSAGKKNIRRYLSRGPRKRWNKTMAGREIEHTKEGFKATVREYIGAVTPDPYAKGNIIAVFEHQYMAKAIDETNVFKTHPRSWQDAYMDTAVNFREIAPTKQGNRKERTSSRDSVEEPEEVPEEEGAPEEVEEMVDRNVETTHKGITLEISVISIQRTRRHPPIHNTSGLTTIALTQVATQAADPEARAKAEDLAAETEEDLEAEATEQEEENLTTKATTTMAGMPFQT